MSHALIPVPFHGQSLSAVLVDNIPHVALKPLCENIGLDWSAQVQKIKRHPVLSSTMVMITTVAEDGKLREMLMMPIKYLNGWLFGVDSNRVNPEIKDRVIEYQRECFEVLASHFMPKVETQYGLKSLPEPPTITTAMQGELSVRVSVIAGESGKTKVAVWSRFSNHFRISGYKNLPIEKYDESLTYLEKLRIEYGGNIEMIAIPATEYTALLESIKRVQGELANEQQHNQVTITLAPRQKGESVRRYLITVHGDEMVQMWTVPDNVQPLTPEEWYSYAEMRYIMIERSKLDEMTAKQLGVLLA